jgi:hypothetical protein
MMNSIDSAHYDGMQNEYVRVAKYGHIFIDRMNCLYLLAFLVTADRHIADKCFTRAMDEYVEDRGSFLDWARKEGRLAVLRHAVEVIKPVAQQEYSWVLTEAAGTMLMTEHQPFAAITSLSAFERFVFVMATIEGLSEEDCAGLLDCSVQEVAFGRELARRIVAMADTPLEMSGDADLVVTLLDHQACGVC